MTFPSSSSTTSRSGEEATASSPSANVCLVQPTPSGELKMVRCLSWPTSSLPVQTSPTGSTVGSIAVALQFTPSVDLRSWPLPTLTISEPTRVSVDRPGLCPGVQWIPSTEVASSPGSTTRKTEPVHSTRVAATQVTAISQVAPSADVRTTPLPVATTRDDEPATETRV